MKLSKKLLSGIVAASLVIGTSITAFAATNDDIISALKNAKVPQTYLIQAQNYLNSANVTSDQANTVVSKINSAAAVMSAAGTTDVTKLSDADKQAVLNDINSAASSVGLTATISKSSNGTNTIVMKDATGNVVANFGSNEVKQTGVDNTVLAIGLFLLAAAAGSAVVVRKKIEA